MPLFPSSYIKTAAAAVQRVRDQLSFPFTARPQAMTVYIRFVELGSVQANLSRVIHIGNTATTLGRLFISSNGSFYQITHGNDTSSQTATLAAAPSYGSLVELRGVLNANGSVLLGQSVAGAAETTTATSATLSMSSYWGTATIWFNSVGASGVGFVALRDVKIVAGVHTMQEMRVWAGTD